MEPRVLKFANPRLLNQLYCGKETNLAKVEEAFEVKLVTREDWLQIEARKKTRAGRPVVRNARRRPQSGAEPHAGGLRQHARLHQAR